MFEERMNVVYYRLLFILRHNIQDQHKHNTPESNYKSRGAVWKMNLKGKDKDAH